MSLFDKKIKFFLVSLLSLSFVSFSSLAISSDAPSATPAAHASDLEDHIKAAEQGDPEAQYTLAMRYLNGSGVKSDGKMVVFWLEKASEQNYAKAVYRYAKLFEEGRAVPMNAKSAAEWYLKAARLGVVGAQRKMGELYNEGKGVNKDLVQAYAWYNIATAASGAVQDKIHREYIGFGLSAAEKDKAQALSAELLKTQP